MKILAKQNRELIMINAQNTQNENDAEKIILQVPEQYEDFNKKIVFITPDGNVWDIITNNEYLIKKAITKYKQVDFYIWLTKGDVDFRSQTKTLKFYQNVDASDEITDEEIGKVNTVVNLLEEEITKVKNLESQIDGKLEEVDTAIQETENLDLDAEKVGQTTTVTLTKKDGTTKTVHIDDGVDLQFMWQGTSLGIKTAEQSEYTFVDLQGEKGDKGDSGTDGISPVVSINKSGKSTTIQITDINGTHTATINDGLDGTGSGDMLKSDYDTNNNCIVDNSEKVNGHTVESDVPANAKFTDTTYANATQESDGLMSKEDKQKLDSLSNYDDTTIKEEINTKANASDVYNKSEIDEKETTLNSTINQTKIDLQKNIDNTRTELQSNIDEKANTSDVYNKTEIDDKETTLNNSIDTKQNKLTAGTGIEITGENIINNIQGNYSTEEVKIGKWIDGKSLYRKVIVYKTTKTVGSINAVTNIPISHNISNLDRIVKYSMLDSVDTIYPLIGGSGSSLTQMAKFNYYDSTIINFRLINTTITARTFYIILEYTKTTD